MKAIQYSLVLTIFLFGIWSFGQVRIQNQEELNQLKEAPLETMYVDYNSTLLFPGEYLYYSLYCINTSTYRLSTSSKIAYVELVSEKGEVAFKHKITLDKGRGQGDFFIPVSLPSGSYKLIGYTRWMLNGGVEQLFLGDIAIINPYQSNQNSILKTNAKDLPFTSKDVADSTLTAHLDKTNYQKRERVQLAIRNYRGAIGYGSYSVTVRKLDDLKGPQYSNAVAFTQNYPNLLKTIPQKIQDTLIVPEQTGELIAAKVVDPTTGQPLGKTTVAVSLPGKDFVLSAISTDATGVFYNYFKEPHTADKIFFQLTENVNRPYTVLPLPDVTIPYEQLSFPEVSIQSSARDLIRNRSIYNQIENAYFEVKQDTVRTINLKDPFVGAVPDVFVLDEYTRFKTLRETLVEVVANVGIKRSGGKTVAWVREKYQGSNMNFVDFPPIFLLNGVLVQDTERFLEFNAHLIESISLVRDQFVFAGKEYKGMIYVETKDVDTSAHWSEPAVQSLELQKPLLKKEYFNQNYDILANMDSQRVPDYRTQLFWLPILNLEESQKSISFFTSDVPGTYEVRLNGFTTYGKPISLTTIFSVGESQN